MWGPGWGGPGWGPGWDDGYYDDGYYGHRVITVPSAAPRVVTLPPEPGLVSVTCPMGCGPGARLEIMSHGAKYFVTVPDGVGPE